MEDAVGVRIGSRISMSTGHGAATPSVLASSRITYAVLQVSPVEQPYCGEAVASAWEGVKEDSPSVTNMGFEIKTTAFP